MVGRVENSKRPTLQEQEVRAAQELAAVHESLGALESLLDALTVKVDDLDRRLCEAESRLEKIVAGQD
jgi:predicted  nucleic acid-binding Zn-ribbon protein